MRPSDTSYRPILNSVSDKEERLCEDFFHIEPTFPYALHSEEISLHVQKMKELIFSCIDIATCDISSSHFKDSLFEKFPILQWKKPKTSPGSLEFLLLAATSKEHDIANKIQRMLQEWVVPGKILHTSCSDSLYFYWDLFPEKSFLIMKNVFFIETEKDINKLHHTLDTLSSDIICSLKNSFSLQSFSKQRPLLQESKQSQIHKQIVLLIDKAPHLFNNDLLIEMGRLFALCSKVFFDPRPSKLFTKIIAFHSLMRISLLRMLSLHPDQRSMEVRYIRTNLDFYFGSKPVLGLVIGVAPLAHYELFEESHILQAVRTLLPNTRAIKGSFYSYQAPQDPISTLYLEIEKKNGEPFTVEEVCSLKKNLEYELKKRIEKLVPAMFMARNEEETMRNVLILSQELKLSSDLPQLMISFDSQTTTDLIFTVILVRVLKSKAPPLEKYFAPLRSEAEFLPDRTQQVGFLRKNTPKEANVFQLKIRKTPSLLRTDSSVNFYAARERTSSIISQAIGPFRDYNGGMILKQGELFYQLQEAFPLTAKKDPELLENFFFSLNPIESQATLSLCSLQTLFSQFLLAKKTDLMQKDDYFLHIEQKERELFIMIKSPGTSIKTELSSKISYHGLCSKPLIHTSIHLQGYLYTGMILPHSDEKKQQAFISLVHSSLKDWVSKIQNEQVLKLSFLELPTSLDPRLSGDDYSHTLMKMLFEGLTRLDKHGKPELAIAKSMDLSSDRKTYRFFLRRSYWSDGSLLCASDFEYSWKKILSPDFPTPFAHVFYSIKNAKAAKENRCSLDDVGIKALDDLTLLVELEHPTSEFLEILALSTFSPIHHKIDVVHPNWSVAKAEEFVCNGPFLIKKITNHTRYELGKNSFYWDKDQVRLQKIQISKDSGFVAREMFKNDELHWMGSPIRPWEPSFQQAKSDKAPFIPIGIHWCIFNTESFPFHNTNLRKAFDLAIDKQELALNISPAHKPASTLLSPSHTMNHDEKRISGNASLALEFFEIALQELGLTRKNFPLITLNYVNTPVREACAKYLVKRWKKIFQIPCRLEGFHFNNLFAKTLTGDFQVADLHWTSSIDHPSYDLNTFKYANLDINFSNWSNENYQKLLDLEREEISQTKKIFYLREAEKLLLDEVPAFPLFYEAKNNERKEYLHRVVYSHATGQIDFKYAYIERKKN